MTSKSVFTLEALQAAHGDCLLLHYGNSAAPRLIVIDGGPSSIYKATLSPRLNQIRASRGGGMMEIRMVMVSHIDDDHITGILDMFADLRKAATAKQSLPYDILTLWHNSFGDLVSALPAEVQHLTSARASKPIARESQMVVASVPQGIALRREATALSLNVNSGFDGLVSYSAGESAIDIGQGLSFTVMGPRKAEIDALQVKWADEVKRAREKAAKQASQEAELDMLAAAFVDKSVTNLSSIVVLAEFQGKTILLTGDARGDLIIESLRDMRRLKNGKIKIDVLKVPHHGSERDVAKSFFETVVADHYVFSANGKYSNPDVNTFKLLFAARPKEKYTLWLTNDVKEINRSVKRIKPPSVVLKIRSGAALSLKIDLCEPLGV
jgi:hypothetical protein